MKKKLLFAALFMTLLLWILTGQNPFQLLVGFLAAGALPGLKLSVSPYLMFILAFMGGLALMLKLSALEIHFTEKHEEPASAQKVKSLKISSNTHSRSTKNRRRFRQIEA